MIKNKLKILWESGQPAVNGWLSIGNSFTAEIMAAQGFDSIVIDLQHGLIDNSDCTAMFQAMQASKITPMARVPWLDPSAIMKVLDAGAYGVICPMINSRNDAERFVSYARYPPMGNRSFGPTRANFSAGSDYASQANTEIICLAMIETAQAMNNLQEIVSTPGLDGVYIGPADLTLGITNGRLGPGFDREEPEIVAAIKEILSAAKKARIRACLHCGSPEYAAKAINWGFDLITVSNDVQLLAGAASETLSRTRELIGVENKTDQPNKGGY